MRTRMKDRLVDSREALYAAHASPYEAAQRIDRFADETGRALRAQVVLLPVPAEEALAKVGRSGVTLKRREVNEDGSIFALSLHRRWGHKETHSARGECLGVKTDHSPAYYLVTDFDGEFWRYVVSFLLKRLYPDFSLPYLSTDQIKELLVTLADKFSAGPETFRILKFNYTVPIDDPHATRQRASDSEFTDLSIELAFAQAKEQSARVKRVEFELRGKTRGYVTYSGDLGFVGDFDVFRETLIERVADFAATAFAKLDQRERVRATGYATRPFFIEFPVDLLAHTDSRRHLIAALSRMPHTSQSMIHENPYIHISILDYTEDTSCDLYVLSPNRICVVPQTNSSATSLARLYSHISRQFAEGRVRDYSEVYPE